MPAEMNHCIQTDHFLSAVVSQGASLRGPMGVTPTRKEKRYNKECGFELIDSSIEQPVGGDISDRSSLFFSQTELDLPHTERLEGWSVNCQHGPGSSEESCGSLGLPVVDHVT